MKAKEPMVRPMSWETFRATGLLWWINRILHTFGWAIVMEVEEDGPGHDVMGDIVVAKVYPARVRYRGFSRDTEESGFANVTGYMASQGDNLAREIDEKANDED